MLSLRDCFVPCRYVEALRAEVKEKMKLYNIDLPPLCSCSSDFWESHPTTCANNCIFYKNHKGRSSSISRGDGKDPTEGVGLTAPREIKPDQMSFRASCTP